MRKKEHRHVSSINYFEPVLYAYVLAQFSEFVPTPGVSKMDSAGMNLALWYS